jgi:S1-C subfamily serine protease
MEIHEGRAEIIEVDGIGVDWPGEMWVPRANVHPGISSRHGMTLVEVEQGGATLIRVDRVEPGSRGDEVGLRVGDVIIRVGDRDVTVPGYPVLDVRWMLDSTASFSVRRGGRRVDLIDDCRAWIEACRHFRNCPRHYAAYCCPI